MNKFTVRYPGFKKKALTLSFDDGVVQDKRLIEILDRYGMKCTFNLNGYKLARNEDRFSIPSRPSITREEAVDVYRNHEVAIHGYQHPFLDEIPAGHAAWQISKDRETLEEVFGRIIRGMAYPMGGTQSEELLCTLRSCGILYARTTRKSDSFSIPKNWLCLNPTCRIMEDDCIGLGREYAKSEVRFLSTLFLLWGHSYELDEGNGWEEMEEFCRTVSGRDDIWYAANGEIFEYLEATRLMRCSADGKMLYNPTCTDIYLENIHTGRRYVLRAGEAALS